MKTPYKLTPLHDWHQHHGGQLSDVNGWIRVTSYGDLKSELDTARQLVAVCDVTPLSKIDIQGQHSNDLLVKVSACTMRGIGRCMSIRSLDEEFTQAYAVQVTSERFLVLSASEQRQQLCNRLTFAAREWECVHVTDMTSAYAAIRVVGPLSTKLLKKLGPAPVDMMGSDQCVQTTIARVLNILVRHKGETPAWLLLTARDYGEYVWDCIMAAGQEFGIRPFGISAERVLMREEASSVAVV